MSRRARHYLWTLVVILVAVVYARLAGDWSKVGYYGGAAALIVFFVPIGLLWQELARGGAFRTTRRNGA